VTLLAKSASPTMIACWMRISPIYYNGGMESVILVESQWRSPVGASASTFIFFALVCSSSLVLVNICRAVSGEKTRLERRWSKRKRRESRHYYYSLTLFVVKQCVYHLVFNIGSVYRQAFDL
jgi:hypothetical protein